MFTYKKFSIIVAIILLFLHGRLFAYEESCYTLQVPTSLQALDMEFSIQHRFYGEIKDKPGDTYLGMDEGANVALGLRFNIWKDIEAQYMRITQRKEYIADVSWSFLPDTFFLKAQADVQYFNYEKVPGSRESGFFFLLSLETQPVFSRVKPVFNAGYDQYNETYGIGFGLSIAIIKHVLFVQGELYPDLAGRQPKDRNVDPFYAAAPREPVYAMGIMLQTQGHHFFLFIGNSQEIGARRMMLRSQTNDFFLGFRIQRLFKFK